MDFPPVAFQTALTLEVVLFAVYGIFYAAYAQNYSVLTEKNTTPAPIVRNLRLMCRAIAVFVVLNALFTVYSLYTMNITGTQNIILSIGLSFFIVLIAFISVFWAFKFMK